MDILEGKFHEGQTIQVDAKNGALVFGRSNSENALGLDRKIKSNSR